MGVEIYKNLSRFNELSAEEAESRLLECSGSRAWAETMTASRPFRMVEEMFAKAEEAWFALPPADQLEAYSRSSHDGAGDELAMLSAEYEKRFGFRFVLFQNSADEAEPISVVKARLRNSVETELRLAAIEQHKILEKCLSDLLEATR